MNGRLLLVATASVLANSCSELLEVPTIKPKTEKKSRFSDDESAGGLAGEGGMGGVPGAKMLAPDEGLQSGKAPEFEGDLLAEVKKGTVVDGMELPSDDQIVWSDPTKPNADIPFGEGFKQKAKPESPWFESFAEARRESTRTGKPILMFFLSSKNASSTSAISRELFAANDFGEWAKDNVVRLRVDIDGGSMERGELSDGTIKRRRYAENLKKQFHVLGYPTVVILQPDGSVYSQERGYKRGEKSEMWGKLKNAALTIGHNHEIWKRKMNAKGYRDWTGTNGQVVFARLARYKQGEMILIEPDGNRIKTSTRFLSKNDRAWIIAEQEKREKN